MAQNRPPLAQDLLWRLEALAYDAIAWLARLFPADAVSDFGAWFFAAFGPLTSANRVAETNLRIVFPQASDAEVAALLKAQWREIGRTFAEFPILDRIVGEPGRVEFENLDRLTAIAAEKRPVVLISGHFSNFEVMAWAILNAGITCQVTYRAANNPHVERRIVEARKRYGVTLFAPKGTEGARELMRALARGESVALLNDQKFNGGVAAPFFGRTAHTAPGPSIFALRFGVPIQPLSVQRTGKARFKVIAHEPFRLPDTGDRNADVEAGVRRINAFMEARILARPAEWFWVHKRWPSEVYRKN